MPTVTVAPFPVTVTEVSLPEPVETETQVFASAVPTGMPTSSQVRASSANTRMARASRVRVGPYTTKIMCAGRFPRAREREEIAPNE